MTSSIVTREQVLDTVYQEIVSQNWRYGQALFNSTYFYYPEFCEARTGTGDDPFYSDNPLDFVCQKWLYELKSYIEDQLEIREATSSIRYKIRIPKTVDAHVIHCIIHDNRVRVLVSNRIRRLLSVDCLTDKCKNELIEMGAEVVVEQKLSPELSEVKQKEIIDQIFEERKDLLALLAKEPGTD